MPEVRPLRPGDPATVGGYRLIGRLGEGGQGVVYLGESESDPARVAIKILHDRYAGDEEAGRRLLREVEATRKVPPFCTAKVLDVGLAGDRPYVVSEFIDGESLEQRVKTRGPLEPSALERLAIGTASALVAIHNAGVVHRDFKPANVLLASDGPRVVDFGIARALDLITSSISVMGTPPYMSPEQFSGTGVGTASDIFSWAGTMIFAATGETPFGQDAIAVVVNRVLHQERDLSDLPENLRPIIGRCLAKAPEQRPTARDLLLHLVTGGAPGAPAPVTEGELLQTATARVREPLPTTPPTPPAQGARPAAPGAFAAAPGAGVAPGGLSDGRPATGPGAPGPGDGPSHDGLPGTAPGAGHGQAAEAERAASFGAGPDVMSHPAGGAGTEGRAGAPPHGGGEAGASGRSGPTAFPGAVPPGGGHGFGPAASPGGVPQGAPGVAHGLPPAGWPGAHPGATPPSPSSGPHGTGPHPSGGPHGTGPHPSGGPHGTGPHPSGGPHGTGPHPSGGPHGTGPHPSGGPHGTGPNWPGGPQGGAPQGSPDTVPPAYSGPSTAPAARRPAPSRRKFLITAGLVLVPAAGAGATALGYNLLGSEGAATASPVPQAGGPTSAGASSGGPVPASATPGVSPASSGAITPAPTGEITVGPSGSPGVGGVVDPSAGPTISPQPSASGGQAGAFALGGPVVLRHGSDVMSIAVTPDGRQVVSGAWDGKIRVWDIATGRMTAQFNDRKGYVEGLAVSPDGRLLVSVGGVQDTKGKVWDLAKRKTTGKTVVGSVFAEFSPDGGSFVTGSGFEWARLWRTSSRGQIGSAMRHGVLAKGAAFSPDGRVLAVASWDDTVRLWNAADASSLGRLTGHKEEVNAVVFLGPRLLASAGYDKVVRLWDVGTRKAVGSPIKGPTSLINTVAHSPQTDILACGEDDGRVWLWNATTRRRLGSPVAASGQVKQVLFTPDGRTMVVAAGDTVQLWTVNGA